jgi:hypothetical protein
LFAISSETSIDAIFSLSCIKLWPNKGYPELENLNGILYYLCPEISDVDLSKFACIQMCFSI